MDITEVRIKLMQDPDDRLRAFCSITLDDAFVIRDLKIIDGTTGPFVAMPSRKLTGHCSRCGCKNHLRASYCNQCGVKQSSGDQRRASQDGRTKLYADIAHPINSACREMIQAFVISAFEKEKILAAQPGYKPSYDDGMDYDDPKPTQSLDSKPPLSVEKTRRRPDQPADSNHHPTKRDNGAPGTPKAPNTSDSEFGEGLL